MPDDPPRSDVLLIAQYLASRIIPARHHQSAWRHLRREQQAAICGIAQRALEETRKVLAVVD